MTQELKINSRAASITNDQVVLPRKLTAENGAKSLLSGEFFELNEQPCICMGDDDCHDCEGTGFVFKHVPISWTTIKAIYKKIVDELEVKP